MSDSQSELKSRRKATASSHKGGSNPPSSKASLQRKSAAGRLPHKRMEVFESGPSSARARNGASKASGNTAVDPSSSHGSVSRRTSYVVVDSSASDSSPGHAVAWYWYLIVSLALVLALLLVVLDHVNDSTGGDSSLLDAGSISSETSSQSAGGTGLAGDVDEPGLQIRIFNGWTISDIDKALATRSLAKEGDFETAVQSVVKKHGLPFAEGFFLAGEYVVKRGDGFALSLAQQMALSFMEAARPLFTAVSKSGMSLADYAVIASMISAETKNEEEYPMISAIIHNRLERGMPLGIDATTRYEIGDWSNPLSQMVLDELTPYNTRRKVDLPPTGICCPSKETLEAAILPVSVDYLYYRHDQTGQIHYSMTYEEHLQSRALNP